MTATDPLETRLAAAELVCHLFGWSPSHVLRRDATDTEKAAHEAWSAWYDLCGRNIERRPSERKRIEAVITDVAARRDAKYAEIRAIIDKQIEAAS